MKGMTNASPGVGQFAAGKLGTIKGGTADGSVQAQEDGTGTVVGWSGKASTADVAKKADKTALDATDAKVTQIQTAVGDCFNAAEITSDGKLQLTAVDGQVNALTLPSGGEKWNIFGGSLNSLVTYENGAYSCPRSFRIDYIIRRVYSSPGSALDVITSAVVYPFSGIQGDRITLATTLTLLPYYSAGTALTQTPICCIQFKEDSPTIIGACDSVSEDITTHWLKDGQLTDIDTNKIYYRIWTSD